jgi:hypothetical protein
MMKEPEETLEVIVRPVKLPPGMSSASGKALWRKREVVKQEKAVYYTTIDDDGGLQELVEKETTQTEVLHMECRNTGEFAHRELTEFEQIETFNDEVSLAVLILLFLPFSHFVPVTSSFSVVYLFSSF